MTYSDLNWRDFGELVDKTLLRLEDGITSKNYSEIMTGITVMMELLIAYTNKSTQLVERIAMLRKRVDDPAFKVIAP